jgi:DNA-binding transcriptional MerR regulator
MPETPDFYDEKAAARIAEVHPRTLRRWRVQGLVASYRTPTGRVRYRLEDLVAAVATVRHAGRI